MRCATAGPGPVMVELPRDVVGSEIPGNAGEYRGVRAARSAPDARDVEDAAKLLVEAACPVILAGQGVLYAEASDELVRLAELLQAPVMTTVDGKSAFPEDHALGPGHRRQRLHRRGFGVPARQGGRHPRGRLRADAASAVHAEPAGSARS